ncbi:UPF0481 protein At3g47200-like [Alnus glutinosa]|uniref:UPF0481 protein At3g47200-like n=1 Tax=Alnus glutinosa TaxID=3517 RepID=UPI002D787C43|nr:UPF0481 protein At3g47200-like [Alnus glutinosa]
MEIENIDDVTAVSTEGSNSVAVEINEADLEAIREAQIEMDIGMYSQDALKMREEVTRERTRCIYRVLPKQKEINGNLYKPRAFSIGPYHYGDSDLDQANEDYKWRCFGTLLDKTQSNGVPYRRYLTEIAQLDNRIRACYSENIDLAEFHQMIIRDGCFIIELFRAFGRQKLREGRPVPEGQPEPEEFLITTTERIVPYLHIDFLLLENQLPFFVLETLFNISTMPADPLLSLKELALQFFQKPMGITDKFFQTSIQRSANLEPMHLLDLVRSSLIPPHPVPQNSVHYAKAQKFPSVLKLRSAGIEIRMGEAASFLEVKVENRVIEMPGIAMDDFMRYFLFNCVAYEQCHKRTTKHMSVYATFLHCLVNTESDFDYLYERKVFELGADAELTGFINKLGKDLVFDIHSCYLSKAFNDVNEFYRKRYYWKWATFKREYYNKPWLFISAFLAFVLLVLTITQTAFAILTYFKKHYPPPPSSSIP